MKNSGTQSQSSFDIRPVAVKKWINDLPLGSTGESSKLLYHALKSVNTQNNNLDQQLNFLEAIAPVINLIYPRLSKYFTDISLPLTTKNKNVIHVTTSLLSEVLTSYKFIIKSLAGKKPFGWKKPFALALHRSFIYYSQILCTNRASYQPYIKGNWHELYWCYQQAEALNLNTKSFQTFADSKTTIDYEFKRLLLLSLLSANELGQKNIPEVHNLMPLWIKNTAIFNNEPDDKTCCFTINLLSDVPPYLVGTRNDATKRTIDRRYLSTLKLKNLLSGYLYKLGENSSIRIANNILSKNTINALLSGWTRNHLRTNVRKEGNGFVDIVTSITAIHFILSQQDQPAYDESTSDKADNSIDFESTLTMEPIALHKEGDSNTLNLGHFLGKSDQAEDIWEKVFNTSINETLPEANWTESGIFRCFTFSKSIILDYSKNGYRLSVNVQEVESLKHNELVAIREHALAPWLLTQVKWLHYSDRGDVQFGLQILSHHVLPVHVSYQANNTLSKPLPCLLGLDSQRLVLFIPTLPTSLSGKKIQLDHQKQQSHIHLKNKILSTTAFDIYEIHENKNMNETEDVTNEKSFNPLNQNKNNEQITLSDNIWENF